MEDSLWRCPSLPAPEHALHAGNPEDLDNLKPGIAIALQVLRDGYGEILAIEPVQVVPDCIVVPAGPVLESTP